MFQPTPEEMYENDFHLKGNWNKDYFMNENPIVLEVGCGKGEYTAGLAIRDPEKNFIGIDIKGPRLWKGSKTVQEEGIKNVAFIRNKVEFLGSFFGKGEILEIWITFPDPQIKYKRTKHRLITKTFLEKYQSILKSDGFVHLKTDSEFLHGYLLGLLHEGKHEVLYAHHDIYNSSSPPTEATSIQTFYEKQYLDKNKSITYVKFRTKY